MTDIYKTVGVIKKVSANVRGVYGKHTANILSNGLLWEDIPTERWELSLLGKKVQLELTNSPSGVSVEIIRPDHIL